MNISGEKLRIPVAEWIASLIPYPPGKPIEELERELGVTDSIKLASNENPIGPSPKAVAALYNSLAGLNRYPDGSCFYLKKRLAQALGVTEDMLIIGNGSNEIIEFLVRAFIGTGDEVVMGNPSFAVYPLVTQASGATAVSVPLTGDLVHDLDAMADAITERTRMVFIANPNNPTGTVVGRKDFDRFVEKLPEGVVLCIDEAYFEYVNDPDFPDSIEYVRSTNKAVIVLRTFSKIYGLSGLRVGYGVADPELISFLDRVRQPFNVNSLAQVAALAALDDTAHVELSKQSNSEGMVFLFTELEKAGFECVPSQANFFLVKVGDGGRVYNELLKDGVIVRPMKGYGLDNYIRVTVGTVAENKRFIDSFGRVISKQR